MTAQELRVAAIQTDVALGAPTTNYARVKRLVAKAAAQDVAVVALPELWDVGYALTDLPKLFAADYCSPLPLLQELAQQHHVTLVAGSVITKRAGKFYNSTLVIAPDGTLVSQYDKVHLFAPMAEDQYLQPGDHPHQFKLGPTVATSVICYDLRFRRWVSANVANQATVIFVPAEWPSQRTQQWRLLVQSLAVEQQAFVVAINRVGADTANEFGGNSLIVAPDGTILAQAGSQPQIISAALDLNEVEAARKALPLQQQLRTDLLPQGY